MFPNSDDGGSAGTVVIRSHAAGGVLYRMPTEERVEVAAFNYHSVSDGRTTLRVMMGRQKERADTHRPETFMETLWRELKAEGLSIAVIPQFLLESREFVYWDLCPDQDHPNDQAHNRHLKAFFAIRLLQGRLREHRLEEDERDAEGKIVNTEILDPPEWYDIGDLLTIMSKKSRSIYTHLRAVVGTLHRLAYVHPPVLRNYYRTVSMTAAENDKIITRSQNDRELVKAYLASLEIELAKYTAELTVPH
ncbi:MAG: hypothetical protein HYV68_00605 [Candidatus Taylorbacteria bacterium]|nr:hypothetical protein [Candidatus Taylorbacteria bacterium]